MAPAPTARNTPPRIESTPARVAGVSTGQIMLWQITIAVCVFAAVRDDWTIVPAGVTAIVVLVLTTFRAHGRWLYRDIAVRGRFRVRRQAGPPAPTVDPRLAPLRTLLPELEITAITSRGGQSVGVVYDGRAWSGAVELAADDSVLPPPRPSTLPLRRLFDALEVDDIRLASVQVMCQLICGPSSPAPVHASYRQLNIRQTPVAERVWVAVRADPELCADAIEARGGGADGARRVVKRAVARVVELLEAESIPTRQLDAETMRSALAVTADAWQPSTTASREDWTNWRTGGSTHVTWWVRSWPARNDPLRALRSAAVGASARVCVVSLTLHATRGRQARFRVLVRLSAATPQAMVAIAKAFESNATTRGCGVVRLAGEQGPGLVATVPLGGGEA